MAAIAGRISTSGHGEPLAGRPAADPGDPVRDVRNDRGDYKLLFDRSLVNRCRSQSVRVTAPGYQGRDVMLYIGVTPNGDVPLRRY